MIIYSPGSSRGNFITRKVLDISEALIFPQYNVSEEFLIIHLNYKFESSQLKANTHHWRAMSDFGFNVNQIA